MKCTEPLYDLIDNLDDVLSVADGVYLSGKRVEEIIKKIGRVLVYCDELEDKIRILNMQLKISEEFRKDERRELSDEEKELAKGLGINIEEKK